MQNEGTNEQKIMNVEPESKDNNKKNKIKVILEVALFTLGALLLTSCSPAKADGPKEQSPFPSYNPTVTATFSPTPSPKVTPEPTPEPTPTLEIKNNLTNEEIIELFGIENPEEIIPVNQVLITHYTIKNELGEDVPQIVWCTTNSDYDENGNEILVVRNLWNEKEILYSVLENGKNEFVLNILERGPATVINEKMKQDSANIINLTIISNAENMLVNLGYSVPYDTEEHKAFVKKTQNVESYMNAKMSKLEYARMCLAMTGYTLLATKDSFDEGLVENNLETVKPTLSNVIGEGNENYRIANSYSKDGKVIEFMFVPITAPSKSKSI